MKLSPYFQFIMKKTFLRKLFDSHNIYNVTTAICEGDNR